MYSANLTVAHSAQPDSVLDQLSAVHDAASAAARKTR